MFKVVPTSRPSGFFARIVFRLRSWRLFRNFFEQPLVKKLYRSVLKEKAKAAFEALPIHQNWTTNHVPPFTVSRPLSIEEDARLKKFASVSTYGSRDRAVAMLKALNAQIGVKDRRPPYPTNSLYNGLTIEQCRLRKGNN